MLIGKSKPDKISLGYWDHFAQAKEIYLRYSNQKIYKITLLLLLSIFISINSAHAGWSQPVRISGPGGGYRPQIIVQEDTLHAVFSLTSAREGLCYLRSTDYGQTWNQQKVLSDTTNTSTAWYPRIMAYGNRLLALWEVYISHPVYHYNIAYSISNNNGLTWNSPQYVLSTNLQWGFPMAASASGSIVNIMAECSVINDTVYYSSIRSTNFGQSWSAPHEIFRTLVSDIPDQVTVNNFVHLVWAGYFNPSEAGDVYYNKSTDSGLNWSGNIPLSIVDSHPSELASICSSGDSGLAVCWMDFKYSPYLTTGDILTRSSFNSGSNWEIENQASYDHFAWNSDIASNGDTIHIIWQDEIHDPAHLSIYYTTSTDNGITWSEPYWIDGTLDNSHDPAMAVSNGRVYVIWYDIQRPDTSGLYFSRYDPDNDAVNEGRNKIPKETSLTAYPNPFNFSVTITYSNLKGDDIGIYDIQGKLIRTFKTEGGAYGKIIWDATNALGNSVSSGEYFLKTSASQNSFALKLLYLK
jgi:hypothetical protein